jgi:hypothetical protein
VYVTRLRSFTGAEEFIRAGIPLIISASFDNEQLDGAGYGTNGHLGVVAGFTDSGDVVVNDAVSHLLRTTPKCAWRTAVTSWRTPG